METFVKPRKVRKLEPNKTVLQFSMAVKPEVYFANECRTKGFLVDLVWTRDGTKPKLVVRLKKIMRRVRRNKKR